MTMRSFVRLIFLIVLVTCLLPGCALLQRFQHKRRPTGQEGPKAPQEIGTVSLVNDEGAFVLIDNGYRMNPMVGSMAQSRGPDGVSAQLKVTEIRKRPFVIADIVSGTPHKGDSVFVDTALTPETKQPAAR